MNRLKELRMQKDYQVSYVASILEVNVRTYYNYENEITAITSNSIKKLMDLYSVTSDYLLGFSEVNMAKSREQIERENIINTIISISNKI